MWSKARPRERITLRAGIWPQVVFRLRERRNHNGCEMTSNQVKWNSTRLNDEETRERVRRIVVEQLGVEMEKVVGSASFIDDLGADSLDTVEFVWHLKKSLVARFLTPMQRRS